MFGLFSIFSHTLLSGNCTVILLETAKCHAPPNKNLYPCTSYCQHLLKSYFLCICSSFTMPKISQAAYPQSCQNCKQRNKKVKPFSWCNFLCRWDLFVFLQKKTVIPMLYNYPQLHHVIPLLSPMLQQRWLKRSPSMWRNINPSTLFGASADHPTAGKNNICTMNKTVVV